ncbi:hypothetical protein Dimus_028399 [Dionaea muscipula]
MKSGCPLGVPFFDAVVSMGLAFLYHHLLDFWPFSSLKADDLKLSDRLVKRLRVPEHTKQFVFAIPEPDKGSVIYIVCAQNLSERSARDVEYLIREVRPDAVLAQLSNSTALDTCQFQLNELVDDNKTKRSDHLVPTSAFKVMVRCLIDKVNKEKYEDIAGNLVLKEIFGVGFYGHFFVAKRMAEELGSSFFILESPSVINPSIENGGVDNNKFTALALEWSSSSNLVYPQNHTPLSPRRLLSPRNDAQLGMLKKTLSTSVASSLTHLIISPDSSNAESEPTICNNYQPPPFAQVVYPLLLDLQSIGRALANAQRMLLDIERGENVDSQVLSEVYAFQIAVEGLRIALNNAGRLPMSKMVDQNQNQNQNQNQIEFAGLSREEKSHCLLAQALRSQAKNYKKIVAVVDASCLADIRKHWNTLVPVEVTNEVEELVVSHELHLEEAGEKRRQRLLTDKPVVAFGAGATAFLGASSLSKVVPASTVIKVVTMNVPATLKIFLSHTHKATAIALSKILGSMKAVAVSPGLASSGGANVSTGFKAAAASAQKIRVVTHSVIASVEKTSFSAMRTAFYEIMRKRRIQLQPVGFRPWATFGCSIATCAGLLVFGDGIECAAESLPTAPSIANLGRGIQSLQEASLAVRDSGRTKLQMALESFMYRFKGTKFLRSKAPSSHQQWQTQISNANENGPACYASSILLLLPMRPTAEEAL